MCDGKVHREISQTLDVFSFEGGKREGVSLGVREDNFQPTCVMVRVHREISHALNVL